LMDARMTAATVNTANTTAAIRNGMFRGISRLIFPRQNAWQIVRFLMQSISVVQLACQTFGNKRRNLPLADSST
jgi:hypothetical protein